MARLNPYLRKENDVRQQTCGFCGKVFVRSEDQKGWRDWMKHIHACSKKNQSQPLPSPKKQKKPKR